MKINKIKIVLIFILAVSLNILNISNVSAVPGMVTRTSGIDRYQTAACVAMLNWKDGAENVVLVSGEGYADSISACYLSKKLNAPMLLTPPQSLHEDSKQALYMLKPKNIYIIGGNASISTEVRDSLKKSFNLIELYGTNRYETNAKVAEKLVELGCDPTNVIMVGGEGFADALSAAPVAAAKDQILLLGTNSINHIKPVTEFIKKHNSNVTVIGTNYTIDEKIFSAVNAKKRIDGGSNRFDTNLEVLNFFNSDLKMDKLYMANATGDSYADALLASTLAGKYSCPLVLIDKDLSYDTIKAVNYLEKNITRKTDLQAIGGAKVLSEDLIRMCNEIFPPAF